MTPPPAATAAGRTTRAAQRSADPHRRRVRRSTAPRAARRVSYRARPAGTPAGPAVALPRLPQLRLPRLRSRGIAAALPRAAGLLRGRTLIWALAAMLLGLVFLQVSLLKLNTQISQNVGRAELLERANATTRAEIARLDAGRRIQDVAAQLGMVMPGAGALCYLDARRAGSCTGGDPSAAKDAVDPAATTAPPLPDGAQAVAGTAAEPAATSPAPTTAPATQPATQPQAPQAQGAPAAQPQAPAAQAPAQQQQQQPAATAPATGGGGQAATGGLVAGGTGG